MGEVDGDGETLGVGLVMGVALGVGLTTSVGVGLGVTGAGVTVTGGGVTDGLGVTTAGVGVAVVVGLGAGEAVTMGVGETVTMGEGVGVGVAPLPGGVKLSLLLHPAPMAQPNDASAVAAKRFIVNLPEVYWIQKSPEIEPANPCKPV